MRIRLDPTVRKGRMMHRVSFMELSSPGCTPSLTSSFSSWLKAVNILGLTIPEQNRTYVVYFPTKEKKITHEVLIPKLCLLPKMHPQWCLKCAANHLTQIIQIQINLKPHQKNISRLFHMEANYMFSVSFPEYSLKFC